jgi:hypothetical protein
MPGQGTAGGVRPPGDLRAGLGCADPAARRKPDSSDGGGPPGGAGAASPAWVSRAASPGTEAADSSCPDASAHHCPVRSPYQAGTP